MSGMSSADAVGPSQRAVGAGLAFALSGDELPGWMVRRGVPVLDATTLPRRPAAQLRGGARVDLADRVVELAHAREAGRVGDVDQAQRGGLDQDACGLRALRAGQRERAGAQLGGELAREVALAVGQPAREAVDAFAVDDPIGNQPHRARREIAAAIPLRRAGRGVRMAAQAGAKAGALGGGRGRVEAHVTALGHDRGAARATVDPGGGDGHEEAPVEAVVAAAEHAVARVEVLGLWARSEIERGGLGGPWPGGPPGGRWPGGPFGGWRGGCVEGHGPSMHPPAGGNRTATFSASTPSDFRQTPRRAGVRVRA